MLDTKSLITVKTIHSISLRFESKTNEGYSHIIIPK